MKVHPTVLLTISDYCTQSTEPSKLQGALYGSDNAAIACSLTTDGSMPVSETLDLLQKTNPGLQLIGWFYVGHGLEPENVARDGSPNDGVLVLIEVAPSAHPAIKAFKGNPPSEVQLSLAGDAAPVIALESAVDFSHTQNEARAKLILRGKIMAIKEQLKSNNPDEVSAALHKYAMLKKVSELQRSVPRYEDDFMYELLAEVVTKSDAQRVTEATFGPSTTS